MQTHYYLVSSFGAGNIGRHYNKQAALEDAQRKALNTPYESFIVSRADRHSGIVTTADVVRYWSDDEGLQFERLEN